MEPEYVKLAAPRLGEMIVAGEIRQFNQLFGYISRRQLAAIAGISYYRVLIIARDPWEIEMREIEKIAKTLKIHFLHLCGICLRE